MDGRCSDAMIGRLGFAANLMNMAVRSSTHARTHCLFVAGKIARARTGERTKQNNVLRACGARMRSLERACTCAQMNLHTHARAHRTHTHTHTHTRARARTHNAHTHTHSQRTHTRARPLYLAFALFNIFFENIRRADTYRFTCISERR